MKFILTLALSLFSNTVLLLLGTESDAKLTEEAVEDLLRFSPLDQHRQTEMEAASLVS